jgi:HEAT repeat protein
MKSGSFTLGSFTFAVLFLSASSLLAAPTVPELKQELNQAMTKRKPLQQFWKDVHSRYGGGALSPTLKLLADESERDEVRWASLFGVARIAGKKSYGLLKKYSHHKSWVLRDASLRAMAALEARELSSDIQNAAFNDPALVVRTTAVDVIGHLKLKSAAPGLVEALSDPKNYRRGKSLWITDHILGVLKEWRHKPAAPALVEILDKTKDTRLQAKVIASLEAIMEKKFDQKSPAEQVYLWKRLITSEKTF